MDLLLTKPLTDTEMVELKELFDVRKFKRNMVEIANEENITLEEAKSKYGEEGEFWIKGDIHDHTTDNYNVPPKGVPGLWCPASIMSNSILYIDTAEDEYIHGAHALWAKWIIEKILLPKGIGVKDMEEFVHDISEIESSYLIRITNNVVSAHEIIIEYEKESFV